MVSKDQFISSTKLGGSFPGNSPVMALLSCSRMSYDKDRALIDSVIAFIDSHHLYSSIEFVLERLNKMIPKAVANNSLCIVLFQKEGAVMKVAGFPSAFLHCPDAARGGFGFNTIPLTYADTNKVFSEILEVNLAVSSLIKFTLTEHPDRQPALTIANNRVRITTQSHSFAWVRNVVGTIAKRFQRRSGVGIQNVHGQQRSFKLSYYARYGVALVVTFLAITLFTNALSKKSAIEQTQNASVWSEQTSQLNASLITTVTEKLPSKYVHEQTGMVRSGEYLFTYQTEPNIILQIDQKGEVKPIVLDSEQIGKLTGMKKLNDELLVFTHTKPGLVFLDYDKRQWRLVKFDQPKIAEFTDIAMYNDFIYVLDARSRQIWKLEITEHAISGAPWMKDSRVDLSLASSMAIDGSVYLTMITGDVVKLTQGKRDPSFTLDSAISPVIRSADAIVLADDGTSSLYVYDRVEKRIIVLGSDGSFVKQFRIDLPMPPDSIISLSKDEFVALIRDQIVILQSVQSSS